MAKSLIERLDDAFTTHADPDKIAAVIGDPFVFWRLGKFLTLEEYKAHAETRIVLLHHTWWNKPSMAECTHQLGASDDGTEWNFEEHWSDWLGQDYWFRSQESFDANPTEPARQTRQGFRQGSRSRPDRDAHQQHWLAAIASDHERIS